MDILLKVPYGRWKAGQLISSRRPLYDKLFALGVCWPEDEVAPLRQKWYKVRPRPKGGFGPWAHALLEAKFGETEPGGTDDGKPDGTDGGKPEGQRTEEKKTTPRKKRSTK